MYLVLVWRNGNGVSGLQAFTTHPLDIVLLAWEVSRLLWTGKRFHVFPVQRALDLRTEMALFDAFHAMLT